MNTRVTTEATAKRTVAKRIQRENESRFRGVVALAKEKGLLSGEGTLTLRGRMPVGLVAEAKRRTGIASDTELVKAALANIAVEDDYWAWFQTRRGTVSPDLDLEF